MRDKDKICRTIIWDRNKEVKRSMMRWYKNMRQSIDNRYRIYNNNYSILDSRLML
jgi:hypothetical protein